MKENKLADLSMEFAVDIINLVRQLKENREAIISNQIGRSGTSIGANIHEVQYAQSKKEPTFVYDKCGFFSTKSTLSGGRNHLR